MTVELNFWELRDCFVDGDFTDKEDLFKKMSSIARGPREEYYFYFLENLGMAENFEEAEAILFSPTQKGKNDRRLDALKVMIPLAKNLGHKKLIFEKSIKFDLDFQFKALRVLVLEDGGIDAMLNYFNKLIKKAEAPMFKQEITRIVKETASQYNFEEAFKCSKYLQFGTEFVDVFDSGMSVIVKNSTISESIRVVNAGHFSANTVKCAWDRVYNLLPVASLEELMTVEKCDNIPDKVNKRLWKYIQAFLKKSSIDELLEVRKEYYQRKAFVEAIFDSISGKISKASISTAFKVYLTKSIAPQDLVKKASLRVEHLISAATTEEVAMIYEKSPFRGRIKNSAADLLKTKLIFNANVEIARAVCRAASDDSVNQDLEKLAQMRIAKLTGPDIKVRSL